MDEFHHNMRNSKSSKLKGRSAPMVFRSIGARKWIWWWTRPRAKRLKYFSMRYIKSRFLRFKRLTTMVWVSLSKCRLIRAGFQDVIEKVIISKTYESAGPRKLLPAVANW